MKRINQYYRTIFGTNEIDKIKPVEKIDLSLYKNLVVDRGLVGDRFYAPIKDLYINLDENYSNLLVSRDFIKDDEEKYINLNIYSLSTFNENKLIPSLPLFISILNRMESRDGFETLINTLTPKFGYGVMSNLYLQSTIIDWKSSIITHYPQQPFSAYSYQRSFDKDRLNMIFESVERIDATYVKLNNILNIDSQFISGLVGGTIKLLISLSQNLKKEILINLPFRFNSIETKTICFFSITEKNIIIDINRTRNLRTPYLICEKIV